MAMLWLCVVVIAISWDVVSPLTIDLPQCEPPDYPEFGRYGPQKDRYFAGDSIHYFCDTDTYIGGNFYRRCEDTGDWSGNTPVCDTAAIFSYVNQTSTADPEDQNEAERAVDGTRVTCSHTRGEQGETWMGMLKTPGELIRVMTYLPKEEVAYEVFMIKRNGSELSCGTKVGRIDYLTWEFHNCPGPHNNDIIGVKIKSLSSIPLRFCEIVVHVLTNPTCVDPHVRIDNGRLQLSRKTANLQCNSGYTRSPDSLLQCVRTGVWNRKNLYCSDTTWEVEHVGGYEESIENP